MADSNTLIIKIEDEGPPSPPQPIGGRQPPTPAPGPPSVEQSPVGMEGFFGRLEEMITEMGTGREDAESGAKGQRAALGIGQALGMAGAPGLGAIASGAAGGPVGIAIAAVGVAVGKIKEGADIWANTGKAILSMDPDSVAQGFSSLAKQIPVVGGVLGGLMDTFMGFGQAIESTSNRLMAFSPQLAQTMAQIEVQRIQRDIGRAQTLGPELAEAMQTRFEVEQKISDAIDKVMPQLLKFFKEVEPVMTWLVEQGGQMMVMLTEMTRYLSNMASPEERNTIFAFVIGWANRFRGVGQDIVDQLQRNEERRDIGTLQEILNTQFGPPAGEDRERLAPGIAAGNNRLGGAFFGVP